MQVCYCIYMCVHVKANLQSHSSGTMRQGLLLGTWDSQIRLGWMFNELWGVNLGLYAYISSTLLTEPFPQPSPISFFL